MAKDLHNEFKNRKIKKPNKLLTKIVQVAFKSIAKKRNVEFFYDEEYLKIKDEQIIYLCQHKSMLDYIYVYAGIKRMNAHVLCGYQNVFQKSVYKLLKNLGVIAKMLYQPDAQATRQMLQALKLGDSLMIFPEGIQSTSGSVHPINPATIHFLKKIKLPVVLVTTKGSYFTRTRYSTDVKKGKISVTFKKLFDSQDFEKLSNDELYSTFLENFKYNEFEEHENNKIAFKGKLPNIHGLDNIIFKCPHCNAEYNFSITGDQMKCNTCDFTISMDEYYDIHAVNKTLPFKNIDEWYKWQRKVISKEVVDDNFKMQTTVKLRKINTKKLDNNYSLLCIGEGVLTLTNKGLLYEGTYNGEQIQRFFEAEQVYSLTMSLKYDLDFYYKNEYINFKLIENERQVAKWMICAEEIHNLYDEAWRKASCEVYDYEK